MKLRRFYILIGFALLFVSCEDLIDPNLNSSDPRVVIEADLNDLSSEQLIRVSRTVDFDAPVANSPVVGATVSVKDDRGVAYVFEDSGNGEYRHHNFKPRVGLTYNLMVNVGTDQYTSTTEMMPFVAVDSLAIKEDTIFDEIRYAIVLKFYDPINTPNYYKYSISINGKPFKFAVALSDKFNDGLYVSHDIDDRDNSLALGDAVVVRRHCVTKPVYTYWNEVQMLNPGSAAPANPDSNISNGALGYFSVSSAQEYEATIMEVKD